MFGDFLCCWEVSQKLPLRLGVVSKGKVTVLRSMSKSNHSGGMGELGSPGLSFVRAVPKVNLHFPLPG